MGGIYLKSGKGTHGIKPTTATSNFLGKKTNFYGVF